MKTVTDAGLTAAAAGDRSPRTCCRSPSRRATRRASPSFADLAKPDLKVVVCAPQVPCGAAAAEDREGHRGRRSSRSARSPTSSRRWARCTSGDADAGLVYVTDVTAAKGRGAGRRPSRRPPRRSPTTRSRCVKTLAAAPSWRSKFQAPGDRRAGPEGAAGGRASQPRDAGDGRRSRRRARRPPTAPTSARASACRGCCGCRPAIAFALIALPVVGLVLRADWAADAGAAAQRRPRWTRCGCRWRRPAISTVLCIAARRAAGRGAGPRPAARAAAAALGRAAAAGAAAGGRRARAAVPARAGTGLLGRGLDTVVRHHRSRSPPRPWCSPRPSSRCRSSWSAWRGRCAPPGSATRRSPRPSARRPGWRSGGSRCRWCCPGCVRRGARVRPLPGRVRRHDRVRRQPAGHHPDPAAAGLPASARPTSTPRSRCRCCWSWWSRSW